MALSTAALTIFLGQHRAKNDTFDQNVDSWYCTCNGVRQYRNQTEVETHIAKELHKVLKAAEAVDEGVDTAQYQTAAQRAMKGRE